MKSKGKISVEPHKGRIVVNLNRDFANYYNWFITKEYWIRLGTPMYDTHITVANTKFHPKINWSKALNYDKKEVEFDYSVDMVQGGFRKGFIMFYIKVYSQELEDIKNKLNLVEGPNYKGLHITIANSKGTNLRMYWPEMIEV